MKLIGRVLILLMLASASANANYGAIEALRAHYARFILDLSLTGQRLLDGCSGRINRELRPQTFATPWGEYSAWVMIGFESRIDCTNEHFDDVGIYMVPKEEVDAGRIRTVEVMAFDDLLDGNETVSLANFDSDGDGHLNLFDRCEWEAEDYDCIEDKDGCPESEGSTHETSECEAQNRPESILAPQFWNKVRPQTN